MLCEDLVERNTDEEHTAGIYGGCDIDLTPGTHLLTGPKRMNGWVTCTPTDQSERAGIRTWARGRVARHAIH